MIDNLIISCKSTQFFTLFLGNTKFRECLCKFLLIFALIYKKLNLLKFTEEKILGTKINYNQIEIILHQHNFWYNNNIAYYFKKIKIEVSIFLNLL